MGMLRAVRDFIIVKPDDKETQIGSIIIPDSGKDPENPRSGVVISVGCGLVEGGHVLRLTVRPGDHIHFPRNSGTLLRKKDNPELDYDVFVLRENQVFGVVEGKEQGYL